MVIAGDFKNGITFEMDGSVYQVIEFQHVKPGKGAAFVRTKLKNVITGGVEPPTFVELEVVDTDPGFAGNTATNTLKPATLETGAEIKVPLFINRGDVIKIDTRTGEYLSRA